MKTNYFIKHLTGSLVFFAILFVSAGRINYWQGWIYVAIGFLMVVLNYTLLPIDDELLRERSKPGAGTKKWDKAILGMSFLVTLIIYVIAGLDSGRFHWSPRFHISLLLLGIILIALGQLLFLIAQKQNRFFSSTVRIQTERGHTVCDTGLYKIVRHPAYAGSMIQALGFPLLIGSLWSIIPTVILILLFIIRTNLEDKTLRNELEGYSEYCGKTRFKVVPWVW